MPFLNQFNKSYFGLANAYFFENTTSSLQAVLPHLVDAVAVWTPFASIASVRDSPKEACFIHTADVVPGVLHDFWSTDEREWFISRNTKGLEYRIFFVWKNGGRLLLFLRMLHFKIPLKKR